MSRRLKKFSSRLGKADLNRLPQDLLNQAEQCPECRQKLDQATLLHRLISLKRYEQPQHEAVEHSLAELHQRLVDWQQHRQLADLDEELPALTGWRYGWAAALVAMLAFNLVAVRQVPTLHSNVAASASPYQAVPFQVASTNRQFRFEDPMNLLTPAPSRTESALSGQTILTSMGR